MYYPSWCFISPVERKQLFLVTPTPTAPPPSFSEEIETKRDWVTWSKSRKEWKPRSRIQPRTKYHMSPQKCSPSACVYCCLHYQHYHSHCSVIKEKDCHCILGCVRAQLFSCIQISETPRTISRQAPMSMEFPSQGWSGLPFPPPGDLPDPGAEPVSPAPLALGGGFFTKEPPEKPCRMWDLIPWPGIEPGVPSLGAQSLNLWTTREVCSLGWLLSKIKN